MLRRLPSQTALCRAYSQGTSLIEVLMAIVIITFGLLGLAALQGRATTAELESYQRGQALILLEDMASRMRSNPVNAASYVTTQPLGTDSSETCPPPSNPAPTRAQIDRCEWDSVLKGISEIRGAGASAVRLGAMINSRGCIQTTGTAREYRISVAWQGASDTTAPPSILTCGAGAYDSEQTRRVIATTVRIPDLTAL